MVLILNKKTLLALLPYFLQAGATVSGSASGSGTTTRYWDCCKPSCAWSGKMDLASGATPIETCSIDDTPLSDPNAVSGCDGGSAYTCSDNSPWAVSGDLAYGYAAVNIAGGSESSWCCACYELTFTSTAMSGKKMIVQATNTGSDLGSNQFDLLIPGGGVGIFNGCTAEWGAPSSGWGQQYGGISSASACSTFPTALQPGCDWRYDWFEGADNPTVDFVQVECPAALTAKTGCVRAGEVPKGASSSSTFLGGSGATSVPAGTSSTAAATSSSAVAATTSSAASASPILSSSSSSAPSIVLQSQTNSQTTAAAPSTAAVSDAASSSNAGVPSSSPAASSPAATSTPSIAVSPIKIPQEPSSSSAESPTTTSAPSKTLSTSLIMVTVTAKPGSVTPSNGGGDYCEL